MKLLNGKGRLKAAGDNVTGSPSRVDAFAGFVPRAIVIYFTFQLAVRLMLSSNLEIDESSFVGAVDWKLGYGDSQPPLYNWLVILFVGVFRYWPAIAILKYVLLGTTFLLVYDTARRSSGSRVTAATSALALAFVYQLIWQSQFTLAHSVLSVAAAAATLHAFVLILQKGRVRDFVWLGGAVSARLLSKYNFAIFFLSAGLAGWSIRDFRHAFHRRTSLISVAVIAATFLPHGLWAIAHYGVTTARLSRLEEDSVFSQLRLSLRGIDGLGSLL